MKHSTQKSDGLFPIVQSNVDAPLTSSPPKKKGFFRRPTGKFFLVVLFALVVAFGWFAVKTFASLYNIMGTPSSNASPVLKFGDSVQPSQLSEEGDDRINILLIGIGGAGHAGAELADTIMVASIDTVNHKVALLSVPRDLRVNIPGHGMAKINAAQSYGEMDKVGNGPILLKQVVSTTLDIPIHYYIRVDFSGFKQFVDKIGGVTVDVKQAISDPFYPDDTTDGYKPFYLKAGVTAMNGELALKYARSRETTSDFDRAARQQQIIMAMKEKLLSLDVLTNPSKLSDLISILGNHVKTDFSVSDIEHITPIVKNISTADLTSKVLDTSADGPLTSINDGGYYIVSRTGNFRAVQRIAHNLFLDPYIAKEAPTISLVNATGKASETADLKLDLEALGYTVLDATAGTTAATSSVVDQSSGTKPFTVKFLSERFGVTATAKTSTTSTANVLLTVGKDYLTLNKATK